MKLIGKPFVSFREMETKFNKVRRGGFEGQTLMGWWGVSGGV